MERRAAKELLHIRGWLQSAGVIVERGESAYLADDLLQEAANRLAWLVCSPPAGVDRALAVANRNVIIHRWLAADPD